MIIGVGQIVFAMQAGALFGYALLWTIMLGTIATILYIEMCHRVATVTKDGVFTVVRSKLGERLGTATLAGANLVNLITCAAELAAVGIMLHLLTGWNERLVIVLGAVVLGALGSSVRLQSIERTLGLLGGGLVVLLFVAAAWQVSHLAPPPTAPVPSYQTSLHAYFAVGIFSALLMQYKVHAYPAGGKAAISGATLGALVMCALLVLGAVVFLPRGIFPNLLSSLVLPAALPLGRTALWVALLGMLASFGGTAAQTAMSVGYNTCQFYGIAGEAPQFTAAWVSTLILATLIVLSGARPLKLVHYAIVLGMVMMPLTYYPMLRAAGDRARMGEHATTRVQQALGWLFFVLIAVAALLAIPLMVLTRAGQP